MTLSCYYCGNELYKLHNFSLPDASHKSEENIFSSKDIKIVLPIGFKW